MITLRGVALTVAAKKAGFEINESFVDSGVTITIKHEGALIFSVTESGYEDRARAEQQAFDFLRANIKNICYAHGDACSSDCRFRTYRRAGVLF